MFQLRKRNRMQTAEGGNAEGGGILWNEFVRSLKASSFVFFSSPLLGETAVLLLARQQTQKCVCVDVAFFARCVRVPLERIYLCIVIVRNYVLICIIVCVCVCAHISGRTSNTVNLYVVEAADEIRCVYNR